MAEVQSEADAEKEADGMCDRLLEMFSQFPHLIEKVVPKLLTFEVGLSKNDHHLKTLYVQNLTKHTRQAWERAESRMAAMKGPPIPKVP
jgi:hypothetical protein